MTQDAGWGILGGMKPVAFEIDVQPTGYGRVVVDGQDVSDQVVGYALYVTKNNVPTLTLDLLADGTVKGVGVVEATVPGDMLEQLATLLTSTDAAALEQQALQSPDLGSGEGAVTAECLRILAERLRSGRP